MNVCTAPGERRFTKEHVDIVASSSPYKTEPRLSTSLPSDFVDSCSLSSTSHRSPDRLSSSLMSPSPASRGCKLQQLKSYEEHHGRLPTTSPRKLSWESPSPGKLSSSKSPSSDVNGISTPTSRTKSVLVLLCIFHLSHLLNQTISNLSVRRSNISSNTGSK